jgi:dipeptidyl aminopeptidase/acylaminoacyl peptidase
MRNSFSWLALFLLVLGAGCAAAPTPAPPTATAAPTAIPTATSASRPTSVPPTPGPTPTLHPALLEATLPHLAARQYSGSDITSVRVLTTTAKYTESLVTYMSDEVRVSGVLDEPVGQGPFPAVVLAHGYYDPAQYQSGAATQRVARLFAENGFVAFAPDFRGYGESQHGSNLYMSGYIIDVLNAGASLQKRANVEPNKIGLWGHSMGGGIAARAMVVSKMFHAVVLLAPISSDNNELVMDPLGGETAGIDTELAVSILQSVNDENLLNALSPKNYYAQVTAPVSIHTGTADDIAPTAWAKAIRDGLKQAGKSVEYYEYPGQGHVITGDLQKVLDERVLNFLTRNLK